MPQYRIVIRKGPNSLVLYDGPNVVHTYRVATGMASSITPEGMFQIVFKTECPGWTNPETGRFVKGCTAENPLGTHWLGFNAFGTDGRRYGIHGTNQPESIGSRITHGCVRMHEWAVKQLYDLVPLGTPVRILR